EALADDLERFLEGVPIHARPVGPAERVWKWSRRRPVIAGLLASLVLVSVLGFAGVTAALVYALEGWGQAREQRDRAREQTIAAQMAGRTAEERRQLADRRREQAETNVVFSRLAQSRLEWRLSNLPASLSLLEQVERPRRGWEWHYLQALHHGELL